MNLGLPERTSFNSKTVQSVIVLIGILLSGNILWTLNKGIIFHDEAWFLLHYQKGAHTIDYSNWHRILTILYTDNLVYLRLVTFFVISGSAFFLGYTANKLFRFGFHPLVAGTLFVIFQFFLNVPVQMVPSYNTMNMVIINIAVSFLLLMINTQQSFNKLSWLFLSGFSISILPFVLVTNSMIIGLFLVLVFFLSETKDRLRNVSVFLVSLMFFPIIYFTLIQNPSDFWYKYQEAATHLSFDPHYGAYGIIKWNARLVLHIIKLPLVIFITGILLLVKKQALEKYKYPLSTVLILAVLVQLYIDVTFPYSQFPVTLWYVVFAMMLFFQWKDLKQNKPLFLLILFFSTLPYFASIGTVVQFQLRATILFPYLAIAILGLMKFEFTSFNVRGYTTALFAICILTFFSFNFRTGWSNYNVLKQTIPYSISQAKGSIHLEQYRIDELTALAPYLRNHQRVMVSHENLWGHVYLLNAKPVYLPFRFEAKYFHYFIKHFNESIYTMMFVELKRKPFKDDFKEYLRTQASPGYELEKIDLGNFFIYRYRPRASADL